MVSYTLIGTRWGSSTAGAPGGQVTWSFATANYQGQFFAFDAVIDSTVQAIVRAAFDRWESVASIDFVEASNGANSNIIVGLDSIDGPGGTAGETQFSSSSGVLTHAEIRFDSSNNATRLPLALHEIGHAIGLGHYDGDLEIMNSGLSFNGTSATDLQAGDIAGARALYNGVAPQVSTIAGLDALIESSALNFASRQTNNEAQFEALTGAYVYFGFGVPTIGGYDNLITNNNSTNFGATAAGAVFNAENIYINAFAALYRFNPEAHARFDAIVGGGALADQLTAVYNSIIPQAEQTAAGRAYFLSQTSFYSARAAELGIGDNGAAVVGAATLASIAVRSDIAGFGDAINDLRAAINSGSAMIPAAGNFTPIEVADGSAFDADDTIASAQGLVNSDFINFEPINSVTDIENHVGQYIAIVGIAADIV